MHTRREMLTQSAKVASLLAAVGLLPAVAHAQAGAYNTAAFAAKTMPELMKALGAGAPAESVKPVCLRNVRREGEVSSDMVNLRGIG